MVLVLCFVTFLAHPLLMSSFLISHIYFMRFPSRHIFNLLVNVNFLTAKSTRPSTLCGTVKWALWLSKNQMTMVEYLACDCLPVSIGAWPIGAGRYLARWPTFIQVTQVNSHIGFAVDYSIIITVLVITITIIIIIITGYFLWAWYILFVVKVLLNRYQLSD